VGGLFLFFFPLTTYIADVAVFWVRWLCAVGLKKTAMDSNIFVGGIFIFLFFG
jgi:hypothetical protein